MHFSISSNCRRYKHQVEATCVLGLSKTVTPALFEQTHPPSGRVKARKCDRWNLYKSLLITCSSSNKRSLRLIPCVQWIVSSAWRGLFLFFLNRTICIYIYIYWERERESFCCNSTVSMAPCQNLVPHPLSPALHRLRILIHYRTIFVVSSLLRHHTLPKFSTEHHQLCQIQLSHLSLMAWLPFSERR